MSAGIGVVTTVMFDTTDLDVSIDFWSEVLDLHVAWAGNYPQGQLPSSLMSFAGTRGGLSFELFGDRVQFTEERNGKLVDSTLTVDENNFFLEQFLDFVGCVESRRTPEADHRKACVTHSIVDAVYASSTQRQPISIEYAFELAD